MPPRLLQFEPDLMVRQRALKDMTDPIDRQEPIDNSDPQDAIDPIDKNEPTDPTDSTEPLDAIESTESWDHSDHFELRSASRTLRMLKAAVRRRPELQTQIWVNDRSFTRPHPITERLRWRRFARVRTTGESLCRSSV